jgi:hypothetical protein
MSWWGARLPRCPWGPSHSARNKGLGGPAPRLPVDPNLGVNSGKPNLGGRGMWELPYITDMAKARSGVTRATSVPFKPEAKKIFDQRVDTLSKEDPEGYCLPPGVPRVMYVPHPMEFLQLPNRIVIIYEIGTLWRNVWMAGGQHPKDPNPTFLGDSNRPLGRGHAGDRRGRL